MSANPTLVNAFRGGIVESMHRGALAIVDADGSVSHCDKYLGAPDYVYGNLWQADLAHLLSGASAAAIAAQASGGHDEMAACPWFHLCQGGCPHERYVDPDPASRSCCGQGPLFKALAVQTHPRQEFQHG